MVSIINKQYLPTCVGDGREGLKFCYEFYETNVSVPIFSI